MTKETVGFMLRLPDAVHVEISARAKKNKRSMNAEIVKIIEDTLTMAEEGLDVPGLALLIGRLNERAKKIEETGDA